VVTWTIIALNVLVFFYEWDLTDAQLQRFVWLLGMTPARLTSDPSSYWTLLTSLFLHGGWVHLVGNMWALYLFGDNVEDRMGPVRYLLFYLLCGIAAGLTHYATNRLSTVPVVGASGAIAGVFGAYFLLFPLARVITLIPLLFIPLFVEIPAVVYFAFWFVSQLFSGVLSLSAGDHYGGVAWWAHVGGFVTGMALLPLFQKPQKERRPFYDDEYWPW